MSYQTQRSAGYPQNYRPTSPTNQGLDRLRYCQEYKGQRRLRHPMDLPRYIDNWTRYSGYLPPARPPRNPPWILQPYADQYRGWKAPRQVYVLQPPGQTPLRQAQARHMAGQRSDINRARDEYEAGDNIDSLAMDLSTMDGADASMYELPIEDWRRVNWQGVTNHVWYYKPIDDRPQYWQKQNHHHIMTVQELQAEARTRQLQLLKTDKAHLLDVLRVNSEVFARQFKELRNHSMHELRHLTVKHKADVDIDYPYSRDDLAFLIADRIAYDAVGEYDASLPVGTSQEQKARNSKETVSAEEQPNIADERDVSTSGEASTFATKSTKRALAGEETESPSKKPKVLSTSAENVEVGSDTGLVNDHVETQVPPVMSELAIPRGAETHDERGTQPDRKPSEGDVFEDESTAKRSTKTKVPKHVMKRFFKD